MKFESENRTKKIDWKRIAIIAIVLCVAGYTWYTENFAPNQGGPAVLSQNEGGRSGSAEDNDYDYTATLPSTEKKGGDSNPDTSSSQKSVSDEPYLQPAGGRNLKSPAGLLYTGGREHRADHVLRHARDIPDRNEPHGVFHADGDDVFRLIDEAYELVKQKSKRVKVDPGDNGKVAYVIDMKREIGFKGGKPGKRANYPKLYKVKLVLGENRVITAYPY